MGKKEKTEKKDKKQSKVKKHDINKEKKEKVVKAPLTLDEMPHMHQLGHPTYQFQFIIEQLFDFYTTLLYPHVEDEKKAWSINLKNHKIKVHPPQCMSGAQTVYWTEFESRESVFKDYLATLFKFSPEQFEGKKVKMRLRISGKYSDDQPIRQIYLETFNEESRTLYLDPLYAPKETLIFLHGFTSDWQWPWKNIANGPQMVFPNSFRYVFPTAPDQLVDIYPGKAYTRPSWHIYTGDNKYLPEAINDIDSIQGTTDQKTLVEAADTVISWIKRESEIVGGSENIYIGGHS